MKKLISFSLFFGLAFGQSVTLSETNLRADTLVPSNSVSRSQSSEAPFSQSFNLEGKSLNPQNLNLQTLENKINNIESSKTSKQSNIQENKSNINIIKETITNSSVSKLEYSYNLAIRNVFNITPNLKQFGYDIFKNSPKEFISIIDYSNYIVGPKDILSLYVWNIPEGAYPNYLELKVDNSGKIYLPKIGVIYIAGKSIKKIKNIIKRKLKKYIKNPKIDLFIKKPRKISVIISGEVNKPGTYNLSSLNTLWDALNLAGGIKKSGSLRKVYLIRKERGKIKKYSFDLYCLLGVQDKHCLKKLNPQNFYLKSGDIIYIPPIYNTFATVGQIKRSFIFEYIGKLNLKKALKNYGAGLSPFANKYNVAILRQKNDGTYYVFRIFKNISKIPSNIKIKDGDIIYISENKIPAQNSVFVKGEILNPGIYNLNNVKDIYTLLNLVKFTPNTNLKFAIIKRVTSFGEVLFTFSPKKVLEKKENFPLKPYDKIIFLNKYFKPPILISGNALKISKIVRYYENITLKDVLNTKNLKHNDIDNIRVILDTGKTKKVLLYKDVYKSNSNFENIKLIPGEKIYIVYNPGINYAKVSLCGAVKRPGVYKITKNTTLYDVLKEAGGFDDNAFPQGIVILRKSIAETQRKYLDITLLKLKLYLQNFAIENLASTQENTKTNILAIINTQMALIDQVKNKEVLGRILGLKIPNNLEKLKNSPYNIRLEDGDKIYVPVKPNAVFIFGAVKKSGAFYVKNKVKLKKIINLAGGYLNSANKDEIYIIKPNGTVVAADNLGWFKSIEDIYVYPGDAIVVPYKLEIRTPILTLVKDITQILYQSAYTFYLLK